MGGGRARASKRLVLTRALLAVVLALFPLRLCAQSLPYTFTNSDPKFDKSALQEDLEYLYNQVHQQKVTTSNLTVNGVVTSVGATTPLCSSGGATPNLSLCGSVNGSSISGNISGNSANVTGVVPIANGGTNANTASGALSNLGAFPSAGGTIAGQTTVLQATFTVTGQDSNGYSVKVSSGIDARSGCILLQNGLACGPIQGPQGNTGAQGNTGPQGPSGQNGQLTFASDIVNFWILASTSGKQNFALTVATDGALVVTSTTTTSYFLGYANGQRKYLSNGSFTSLLTADDLDGALRMSPNTVTLRLTDLAVDDANGVVWDISMDGDGVIRTTPSGSL